mgnify:CR=1 FL=1
MAGVLLSALAIVCFTGTPTKPQSPTVDALFKNPPNSAKPHTWWHWMNGNVTKEGITADLEAMARVGIGGAARAPSRSAHSLL